MNPSMLRFRIFPQQEGLWPYLQMLNLGIPIYFMLQEPMPWLGLGFALLTTLLMLHFAYYWRSRHAGVYLTAQLGIILFLSTVYHPMYAYIVFILSYPLSRLDFRMNLILSSCFGIGLMAILVQSGFITQMPFMMNMLPPLFGGCVIPFAIRASHRYQEMNERLQAATSQIERFAQQEERQRIARELHDTLGHTLSLISLKSELAEKLALRSPERAAQEAREIRETASAALKQMRELVSDMKVVRLGEEWEHARSLCAAADIELHVDQEGLTEALSPLQESILAMSFREALTNIVRHSKASKCTVKLYATADSIRFIIQDDGIGFQAEAAAEKSGGNGLIGIKQRLSLLEGRLQIYALPGKGTRLELELPRVHHHREGGSLS